MQNKQTNKKVIEQMDPTWHPMCPKKAVSEQPASCPPNQELQSCGTASDRKYWCAEKKD
jgi:hypothetical protein